MTTTSNPNPNTAPTPGRISRRLIVLSISMILALLLQVIVGVANALWLNVPETGNGWATAAPLLLLNAHLLLGTAITGLGLWLFIEALRTRHGIWIISSIVGLLGVVVALGGGSAFLSTNGSAVFSFMMAIGCVIAIGAYLAPVVKR